MRGLSGLNRGLITTICIVGAIACSDDDKGKTLPDGAPVGSDDAGSGSRIDSGLDASMIGRVDATVLPDGNVIIIEPPPPPDAGNQNNGQDSGLDATVALPCNGSCNDNVDCTIDTCVNGACQHRVDDNICAAGSSCSVTMGCQQGIACNSNAMCMDNDACTTNERCNMQLARCEHDVLDRDGDGYPPAACGGTDCDDTRGLINPSARETCDGVDNNCNNTVDDGVQPAAGYTCTMGQIQCATGFSRCGGQNGPCIDLKTNHESCGMCGNACDSGETCENGECKCTPGGNIVMCGMGMNAVCSDITKSQTNCGGCNMPCAAFTMGGQAQSCIASACTKCGGEGQACCAFGVDALSCAPGLSCSGTPGAAGAVCGCGAGSTKCGEDCVDLKTSFQNCGMCGHACEAGEVCTTEGATTSCKPCGGLGERCCATPLGNVCTGGRVCGPDDSCVVNNAGGGGGGPGNGNGPGLPPG